MDKVKKLTPEMTTKVNVLKALSKHFEIDLTIKVFGISIIHFHWPPTSKND